MNLKSITNPRYLEGIRAERCTVHGGDPGLFWGAYIEHAEVKPGDVVIIRSNELCDYWAIVSEIEERHIEGAAVDTLKLWE